MTDKIAIKLGMDPTEFQFKNVVKEGMLLTIIKLSISPMV